MTDGGSLMALRMGTSIMPASIVAAVNPALWHLLLLLLFPYKYYVVVAQERWMNSVCDHFPLVLGHHLTSVSPKSRFTSTDSKSTGYSSPEGTLPFFGHYK